MIKHVIRFLTLLFLSTSILNVGVMRPNDPPATQVFCAQCGCVGQAITIIGNTFESIKEGVNTLLTCPCGTASSCHFSVTVESEVEHILNNTNSSLTIATSSVDLINSTTNVGMGPRSCNLNPFNESLVDQLESNVTTMFNQGVLLEQNCPGGAGCVPIPLSPSGSITITQPGNYCLLNNAIADIIITGSCITLDLNNRRLTGTVVLENGESLVLKNGFVQVVSPVKSAGVFLANATHIVLEDVIVDASATNRIPALNGVSVTNVKDLIIRHSQISAGNGLASSGGSGISADNLKDFVLQESTVVGGNGSQRSSSPQSFGGEGIAASGSGNYEIQRSVIIGGNGASGTGPSNNGGNGGTGLTLSGAIIPIVQETTIKAGIGGDTDNIAGGLGGAGILYALTSGTSFVLQQSTVLAGNGGNALSNGNGNNGGVGFDLFLTTSVVDSVIDNCFIQGGMGGAGFVIGGFGGIGLNFTPSLIAVNPVITNSQIVGGSGGNGGGLGASGIIFATVVSPLVEQSKIVGGNGGNGTKASGGGAAIVLENSTTNVLIDHCEVIGGDLGSGTISFTSSSGDAVRIESTAGSNNKVHYCTLVAGKGSIKGNGVNIFSGPQFTDVLHNNISNANLAVNDQSNTSNSVVYNNFAYEIQNTSKYIIQGGNATNIFDATLTTTVFIYHINANYFVP